MRCYTVHNICVCWLPWHPRCSFLHPSQWCRTWCTCFCLPPALRFDWKVVKYRGRGHAGETSGWCDACVEKSLLLSFHGLMLISGSDLFPCLTWCCSCEGCSGPSLCSGSLRPGGQGSGNVPWHWCPSGPPALEHPACHRMSSCLWHHRTQIAPGNSHGPGGTETYILQES